MGAVLGSVASAATNFGLSKLFGKKNKVQAPQFVPPSINAGGFKGSGGNIKITPERSGLTGQLAGQFVSQADLLNSQINPLTGLIARARRQQIEDAGRRSIGNLRENLQRRRIAGSSFGADAISRADLEVGKQLAEADAQTGLDLIRLQNDEANLRRQAIEAQLSDLNTAADIGLQLSGRAATQLAENQRLRQQLAMANAQGAGQFFGQNIAPIGRAFGNFIGGQFGGGGTFVGQPSSVGPFGPGTRF